MAQNDLLKRYLDAGIHFTSLTQARAEALVRDLVQAGEVQADQTRDTVADLLERSRKSSERLLATVRKEVRAQITNLGLASQADLDRIERRVQSLLGQATSPAKKAAPAKRKATAKKAAPAKRKATAKKAAPAKRKATAKQAAPAKRSPATKKA